MRWLNTPASQPRKMNLMRTFNHSLLTPNQVYFGYEIEEAYRLVRYRGEGLVPTPGFFTDYFGIKTRLSNFTDHPAALDQAVGPFPFPSDGLHSETVEYLGTVKALEATTTPEVTVVEMGAGYAPWLVFSGKVAQRRGASRIRLIAVEAEAQRHALAREHFTGNGFPAPGEADDAVRTQIIHGAISDERGTLFFGSGSLQDWGGAVQEEAHKDLRGADVKGEKVPALLISDVLEPLAVVDLMHMDIQGWEARALRASLQAVCAKVRYMVIGTHSRVIEGELIAMLRERGWKLMHEKPCHFHYGEVQDLSGATTVDGAQVWANSALGASAEVPADLTDDERQAIEALRETVGWQHLIAKEHVWKLDDRIRELEKKLAMTKRPWWRKA